MRNCHPNSTRSVFGITALCGILTVQIAWAANWTISVPTNGSAFTKTANVACGGMTDAADSSLPEIGIAPVDLRGEFAVDHSRRSAARNALVAVTGKCTIGETKVTQAFVRAEIYTLRPNGPRVLHLIHQESLTTAKAAGKELPYRVEIRMPADATRYRLRVTVVHFPWDFDPKRDSLPDEFTTVVIADGELTVE